MTIKIVIDMNLSREWVEVFRKQGWQAVHWSSLGAPDARDEMFMAWAVEHQHKEYGFYHSRNSYYGKLNCASGCCTIQGVTSFNEEY